MKSIGYSKLYIFIFSFFLLMGCVEKADFNVAFSTPVFIDTLEVQSTVINDTFRTSFVEDMALYKEYLIVKGRTKDDFLLNIFDRNTGKRIRSFAGIGRGPGEVLALSKITVEDTTGILYTKDLLKNEIYWFNLDSVIADHPCYYGTITVEGYMKMLDYVFPLPEGLLFVSGKSELYRPPYLCIINKEKQITASYDIYPSVKGGESDTILPFYCQLQPRITVSPDGTKLAEITSFGGIFRIFDLRKGIHLTYYQGFCKPEYEVVLINKKFNILKKNDRSRQVVEDIYATDRYVYIQYQGTQGELSHKNIAVFTWEGKPLRMYKTNRDIGRFCVDRSDRRLYFSDYDEHLAYFDL